jgi:DNA-binding PadR family transcriptional regulator
VLLGFLYQNPNHGYNLHKRMETVFENIWHGSQSQTYNILKRLEGQGYISLTELEQEKLPTKQLLHITETGKQRFETWLNCPTKPSVHAIRVEFISRLYFMQLYYPLKVPQMIRAQAVIVDEGLDRLEETRRNLPANQSFNRLALELRIRLLISVIDWLNDCGAGLADTLSLGGDDD